MVIEQNYFTLFGLPQGYPLDAALLQERYRALQKELHPDRYAHLGAREQLRAVQVSAHLNDALTTLKSPLKRAAYLLALNGIDTDASATTISDHGFLMQQMLLREELDDVQTAAAPFDALEQLLTKVEAHDVALKAELAEKLVSSDPQILAQALEVLRKLQFFDKLRHQIELLEDQLADV